MNWRCFFGHDWWSRNELLGKWLPTPDWYVGISPPRSKTCRRCDKREPVQLRSPIPPSPWRVPCQVCGTVYVGHCPRCHPEAPS